MTDEEYQATQDFLMMLAKQVQLIDVTEFLNRISLAHAIGPMSDPTLYRKAQDKLDQIESIARAAAQFKKIVLEVQREGR